MADQKTESFSTLPPIWKQPPENAIHVDVCRNGDANFRQTVVLNKKRQPTFDSWLEHLSTRMNLRCGAVWRVFTPTHGHRIRDYESLQDGNVVVVAGQEKFKPCRYKDIDMSPKRSRSKQAEELPETSRRLQVSAKHTKIKTQATAIKCWLNGKGTQGPKIILLPPRRNCPKTVEEVVHCVSCVMEECCWGVVDKLYQLNGIKVMSMDQIVQNGNYFAVLRKRPLVRDTYRDTSLPAFICSPQSRRRLPPIPGSNKTSSHSSPEHSVTSRNGSENHSDSQRSHHRPHRRERHQPREDKDSAVVMAHPVKVKRKQQPNYDQDKGGVFKAKNENRATRGARTVEDSAYTHTELPVDQRVAEPVMDEDLDRYSPHDEFSDESDRPPHSQEQERTYRTNARRAPHSTPPGSEESRREKEKQARERRQEEDRARAERQQQQQDAIRRKKKEKEEERRRQQEEREEERKRRQEEKEEERRRAEKERKEEERKRRLEDKKNRKEDARKGRSPTPEKSRHTPQRGASPNTHHHQNHHHQQQQEEEEEWAATKIQAGFRGYRERRHLKNTQAPHRNGGRDSRHSDNDPIPFLEDEDLDLGPGPQEDDHDRHHHDNHHHRHDDDEDDDYRHHHDDDTREQEKAATKIQAGFRGARARREVEEMRAEREAEEARREEEQAATKIQAGFRGAKARREVEVMRAEKEI